MKKLVLFFVFALAAITSFAVPYDETKYKGCDTFDSTPWYAPDGFIRAYVWKYGGTDEESLDKGFKYDILISNNVMYFQYRLYALLDKYGNEITVPKYQYIGIFDKDVARVRDAYGYGVIKTCGKEVIPCGRFKYISEIYQNKCVVLDRQGRWVLYNFSNGDGMVLHTKKVLAAHNGFIACTDDGEHVYFRNFEGVKITEPVYSVKYSSLYNSQDPDKFMRTWKQRVICETYRMDGTQTIINSDGKELVPRGYRWDTFNDDGVLSFNEKNDSRTVLYGYDGVRK